MLEDKRKLERDLCRVRKILEEVHNNPKLKELQELTASDAMMSTIAIDAMSEQVKEIIGRIPPPPPPPQPKPKQQEGEPGEGGQGEGEGQGGQPNPSDEGEEGD